MRRYGSDADEDDIRARPNRRGSRPRTRTRPAHDDAGQGMVVGVDRGRFTCLIEADTKREREISAMKARELGRKGVVIGDRVALVGDLSGEAGALARIVRVEPRVSVLRRTADDDDPYERIVVANADQLAIVIALADPEPHARLIDRCLVAAYDAGLAPLLILTKSDLADAAPLLDLYAPLGVQWVVTRRDDLADEGAERVLRFLRGQTTVFIGHSGVGKTTLVNALVPASRRSTGAVDAVTGRGRHTTTAAVALRLAPAPDTPAPAPADSTGTTDPADAAPTGPGWVIDTPGFRSFGLSHVDPDRVIQAFPDLLPGTADCPRACGHDEPDCALDAWVAAGHADPARLYSLRRLLSSREANAGD